MLWIIHSRCTNKRDEGLNGTGEVTYHPRLYHKMKSWFHTKAQTVPYSGNNCEQVEVYGHSMVSREVPIALPHIFAHWLFIVFPTISRF
jgi:hypothetical protein